MPVISNINITSDVETIEWQGLLLKNLSTEGERSATGMDAVRGVYVVGMAAGSPLQQKSLKANDVILKVDNQTINNLKDFIEAIKTQGNSIRLNILRNQLSESVVIEMP